MQLAWHSFLEKSTSTLIPLQNISDPPDASAERSIVLGGEDCSIELVCNVEGKWVKLVCWVT